MYFGFGEIAALATAVSWAGSCQVHTLVVRQVGTLSMLVARVPLFVCFMALISFVSQTSTNTPVDGLIFISVSACMVIVAGDLLLYYACVTIGPRLAVLILSMSSCFTAIAGYVFLGETIGIIGIAGILTAIGGVAFVTLESGENISSDLAFISPSQKKKGFAAAWCAALALSAGFLFLKMGLLAGISPIWSSFLRIAIGGAIIWCIALARQQLLSTLRTTWTNLSIVKVLFFACCISAIGNVLAPVAMYYTETGIAATLIGLQPVIIIPISALIDRTIPSPRAIIGTLIAFAGIAMIFLR